MALALPVIGLWLLASGPALAQATVPADPPPAGSPEVVPEQIEPDRPIEAPPAEGESLTDELTRTRGIIEPPQGVDPEIVEPPPDGGAAVTPVIPPTAPAPPPE
jgi:hypothetical protein